MGKNFANAVKVAMSSMQYSTREQNLHDKILANESRAGGAIGEILYVYVHIDPVLFLCTNSKV